MRRFSCLLSGLLIMLTGGGCSLFREVVVSRQDSLRIDSRKVSLDWEVDSKGAASRVFSYSDSSGAEFEVEIVPSGGFTFSAEEGFAGSASWVRLRGKTEARKRGVDSSMENRQLRSMGSVEENTKVKTETTLKERTKRGNNRMFWWMLALSVIGLLVVPGLVLYRRRSGV